MYLNWFREKGLGRPSALLLLLAVTLWVSACGGGDQGTAVNADGEQANFNAVVTSADSQVRLGGSFRTTKGYLSQGRTLQRSEGAGPHSARFALQVPRQGYYEVFAWWPQALTDAGQVRVDLRHAQGVQQISVDQSALGGQWNSMGVYALAPGDSASLTMSAMGATRLYADAIRIHWIGPDRPAVRLSPHQLSIADKDDPYSDRVMAWGGTAPYRFRLLSGALPDGLHFEPDSGRIHGVPAETGNFRLRISVIDSRGQSAEGEVELDVVISNDTPASVPPKPFKLQGDRKRGLEASGTGGPQLGNLPSIVRAMPEGTWSKVNLNAYSDAWVPADLRPLYFSSNPSPAKIITAWSSFAWDSNRGNLLLYGGGHANYRGNEVYLWRGATQMWERASLPSEMRQDALGIWNAIDSADAAPASAHTYDNTLFFPVIDRMVVLGGGSDSNGGHYLRTGSNGLARATGLYLFDPTRAHPDRVGGSTGSHVQRVAPFPEVVGGNMWSNRDMWINVPGEKPPGNTYANGCTAYTKENGRDVAFLRIANSVHKFTITDPNNPASDVWQKVGTKWAGSGNKATCSYDPERKVLLRTATNAVPFGYWLMTSPSSDNRDVNVTPADPSGTFMPALASGAINIANCGLEFDPKRRNYKLWCGGGTVWQLTPPPAVSASGWSISPLAPVGSAVPDPTVANGVLGKWKYIENLDVFMALQDSVQGNIWIYKPVGWVDPGGGGNLPPTAILSQPLSGAAFDEGTAIPISATAADADGFVAKVEFFSGANKIGESTAPPYNLSWLGAAVGNHVLTAVATDNQGSTGMSSTVSVTVNPVVTPPPNLPPQVNLSQPATGTAFTAGQPIVLVANALDLDGSVQRVEFYAGILKIGESTASPFSTTWTSAPSGSHQLSAIAYDDDGAQTTSTSVAINVLASTGLPQTVTIQRGVGAVALADAYLSSHSATRNYGTAESMLELSSYNVLMRMAIFHSEGGPVPNGATIESAVLSVYKWSSYAMTYGLHRVLQPWSETGATWNQRSAGAPWAAPGGKVAGVDYAAAADAISSVGYEAGWLGFNITASVQQMSTTVLVVNNGWRLEYAAGSTSALKRFHSSEYLADITLRPKLVVTYR